MSTASALAEKKETISVEITHEQLDNLMTTVFESSAIVYWCPDGERREPQWTSVLVECGDDGKRKRHKLSMQKLLDGIAVCARKCPNQFAAFLADRGDMHTADAIIQCALFGDVVYG